MPPPTIPPTGGVRARVRAGARRTAASTAKARLAPRHPAVVGIEELLLHLRPAAEVVHREELRTNREAEALGGARQDGPVPALGEEVLRRRRVEEVHERLRGCRA